MLVSTRQWTSEMEAKNVYDAVALQISTPALSRGSVLEEPESKYFELSEKSTFQDDINHWKIDPDSKR